VALITAAKCFIVQTWNPYRRGRLSTIHLLIKMGCFGKEKNILSVRKAADLN